VRTPVTIRTPIVADVEATIDANAEAETEIANARTYQTIYPLDDEGWRQCARPGCEQEFKPKTTYKGADGVLKSTEVFCSSTCASINYYAQRGEQPRVLPRERVDVAPPAPAAPVAPVRVAIQDQDEPEPARAPRAAHDDPDVEAFQTQKYGPMRTCGATISETEFGKRTTFVECGHEGSVAKAARRGRCRLCRNATLGVTPKRGRPKGTAKKSTEGRKPRAVRRKPMREIARPKRTAKKKGKGKR